MIRRHTYPRTRAAARVLSATDRRVLAELDEKPGLGERALAQQAALAQNRMRLIDAQPKEWRDLLNDYPHQIVATCAESMGDPARVRRYLEMRFGRAV